MLGINDASRCFEDAGSPHTIGEELDAEKIDGLSSSALRAGANPDSGGGHFGGADDIPPSSPRRRQRPGSCQNLREVLGDDLNLAAEA